MPCRTRYKCHLSSPKSFQTIREIMLYHMLLNKKNCFTGNGSCTFVETWFLTCNNKRANNEKLQMVNG